MKNPHQLHKYGTVLLWIGVLVWVPYFALRIAGESPSMVVYLPFHLAGVIGGARMRMTANQQLGKPKEKRKGYQLVARVMVIASLFVWLPYYALKLAGQPVEVQPYLAVHLVGVFGGTGLMGVGGVVQYIQKKRME